LSSNIYKLLTWLSPSFPVSSYAYSHAFEQLIEKKIIKNGEDCFEYIVCLLENGSLKIDAVLINNLYKAIEEKNDNKILEIINYYQSFFSSKEFQSESFFQGEALFKTAFPLWSCKELDVLKSFNISNMSYVVVLCFLAKGHSIKSSTLAISYLHAFVSNLVSCAIRLIPLGQTEGQLIISKLEKIIENSTIENKDKLIEEVGSSMVLHDIASMRHEHLTNRLFRS